LRKRLSVLAPADEVIRVIGWMGPEQHLGARMRLRVRHLSVVLLERMPNLCDDSLIIDLFTL